jgi:hypothetical protein
MFASHIAQVLKQAGRPEMSAPALAASAEEFD